MEKIKTFIDNLEHIQLVNSIIVIFVSIFIYKVAVHILNKSEKKNNSKLFSSNKSRTYIKLLRSIIRYIFIIVTILIVLEINGVDVSSLLAGVGILGVVIGLAIQDWLKDIIRGSSIITDNYFSVGDIVKYKGIEGKVNVIGLKTTKIQDLATNNILSIANRNIEEIEVVSDLIYVRVPMSYNIPIKRAEEVIKSIIENVTTNQNVEHCKYKGVAELADSSIQYLLEVKCRPMYKLQVKRDTLKSILVVFEENKMEVPYTQIDIHNI